jgi:hypothetical protein
MKPGKRRLAVSALEAIHHQSRPRFLVALRDSGFLEGRFGRRGLHKALNLLRNEQVIPWISRMVCWPPWRWVTTGKGAGCGSC